MILKVKITPSSHPNNPIPSTNAKIQLTKPYVLIGRSIALAQKNTANFLEIKDNQISRKHVRISIPPFIYKNNKQLFYDVCGVQVPKYYYKIMGIFQACDNILLSKIRQYADCTKNLLLKDLGSTAGTFVLMKSVKLSNSYVKSAEYSQNGVVQQNCILQVGGQLIKFQSAGTQLSLQQAQQIYKQCQKSYQNVMLKTITKNPESQDQNVSNSYYCLGIHCLNSHHKITHTIFVILQKGLKFMLGRHSLCDIHIQLRDISRKQLEFYVNSQGEWVITDCGKTNRVWLKRDDKVMWKIGDEMAQKCFTFKIGTCQIALQIQKLKKYENYMNQITQITQIDQQTSTKTDQYSLILKDLIQQSQQKNQTSQIDFEEQNE